MVKGHERESGKNFIKITANFKNHMQALPILHAALESYPDEVRVQTIENLCETLIYEKIGTYLRRKLIAKYYQEENEFIAKCIQLETVFLKDLRKFNYLMSSSFKPVHQPDRSLKIFKLLLTKS
jgi:hypothetical protein